MAPLQRGPWGTALAALAAVAVLMAARPVPAATDPIVGRWTGTLEQQPAGVSASSQVEYEFTAANRGISRYRSEGCVGRLTGQGARGQYRYEETILEGAASAAQAGCLEGTIVMTMAGDTAQVEWSGAWHGRTYHATGTLTRAPQAGSGSWTRGRWQERGSTANLLGTCFRTWTCEAPDADAVSGPARLVVTPAQRTAGACQMTDNPEECGRCVANPPEAQCKVCLQPEACTRTGLGWRTRQALGCCPTR